MRRVFLGIALALFVTAIAITYLGRHYIQHGAMIIPDTVLGLLVLGLSLAGGLALVAAALDRPMDDGRP